MARVYVLNQTSLDEPTTLDQWTLWFQWCRYLYDGDREPQYGYRFIWRRSEDAGGGLQAARGQARIPSVAVLEQLVSKSKKEGWGNYDGDNYPNAFSVLQTAVDSQLNPKFAADRGRTQIRSFIEGFVPSDISLYEFARVIGRMPEQGWGILKSTPELYQSLDDNDREQLKAHYLENVEAVENRFPELVLEFPNQFRKQ
jgi:hypothetical protein